MTEREDPPDSPVTEECGVMMEPMERLGIRVSLERRVNLVDLVEMDTPERG